MHNLEIIRIGDGNIGGKATGLIKVINVLKSFPKEDTHFLDKIALPKTLFITTSIFNDFVKHNELSSLIHKVEQNEFREEDCEELKSAFRKGTFPDDTLNKLIGILETFTEPMVIRSSSLLEDQKGAAFAGKYDSIFVGNQGSLEERKTMLLEAIKKVYSTTYNPNALTYRLKHGFLEEKEEMALVVQTIVGQRHENYYLPAMAGVGFSQNGYCWNKEIKKEDGLVRLVFGLGTRAVGRGYVRLFSPIKPSVRPEGTEINNIQKCSQKKVDVIDLENNSLKEVHFRELVPDGFKSYPGAQPMVSLRDGGHLYRPASNFWDSNHIPVLTMDGALSAPWMNLSIGEILDWLLKKLEKNLGFPVDLEFAINVDAEDKQAHLYILQTRPLSESEGQKPQPIPEVNKQDIRFSVQGKRTTAYVPNIE